MARQTTARTVAERADSGALTQKYCGSTWRLSEGVVLGSSGSEGVDVDSGGCVARRGGRGLSVVEQLLEMEKNRWRKEMLSERMMGRR